MENFPPNSQIHWGTLRRLLLISYLLASFYSYAQLSTSSKKGKKLYEKAEKAYKERDFELAISHLEQAAHLDTTFIEAYMRLANLYNAMGEVDSVYAKYEKYLNTAPNPSPGILEKMAYLAFDRGDYTQSVSHLKRLFRRKPEKRANRGLIVLQKSQAFALARLAKPDTVEIKTLPKEVNQYPLQYLPTMTVDRSTLVYTKRSTVNDDEDIVVSYFKEGQWTPAASISPRINTELNEGACSISGDGRTMIFTACDRRDAVGSCDLYITRKTGTSWARPKNLGKTINSKYWESQPSLSADGNTLYFVSNRPGGYGGRDIWVSTYEENKWTLPKNLGNQINTSKDEITPFIHFGGQSLYFSSNGYVGMGGFDLYKSALEDTAWAAPENLGYPINSHKDEVALLVNAEGTKGYFAKEVKKGRQIMDSKMVSFQLPDAAKPAPSSYLIGKVIDQKNRQPLKANIEVIDLLTEQAHYNNYSDSLTGTFYMVLPSEKELAGYVKKKGYLYHALNNKLLTSKRDTLEIALSKIAAGQRIILNNIYFEIDSYELNKRSNVAIAHAIEILKDHPEMVIEIEGHTDNTGSDAYNMKLSENRAKAVQKALLDKDISADQLYYKGYGAQNPINPNDSEKNRQSNRRIEFRVIRTEQ